MDRRPPCSRAAEVVVRTLDESTRARLHGIRAIG